MKAAHGRVFKYGDNVDTDVIIPARYLNSFDAQELASHAMVDIDPDFVKNVKKGDPMLKLDLDYIKSHAPSIVSPILCTELEGNQKIRLLKEGKIKAGEPLFAVDTYE